MYLFVSHVQCAARKKMMLISAGFLATKKYKNNLKVFTDYMIFWLKFCLKKYLKERI